MSAVTIKIILGAIVDEMLSSGLGIMYIIGANVIVALVPVLYKKIKAKLS